MSTPFIAQVMMFGGNFAPRGWAFCDGQLLQISMYDALFSIIGTIYGGDGRTTFALPDLRSRVSMHPGTGPGLASVFEGQRGGNERTTLNINNLPPHSHTTTVSSNLHVGAHTGNADSDDPDGSIMGTGTQVYFENAADVQMNAAAVTGDLTVANTNTGSNESYSNEQPFLVVNYIIALEGIYPSRY